MKNFIIRFLFATFPSFLVTYLALNIGSSYLYSYSNNLSTFNKIYTKQEAKDLRIQALKSFFEKYNSPLKDFAETFVITADKYNIDYKLLPAISCMESTCAKKMIPNSYNPFGWGIFGNNYITFKSYDHAILTVGEGLHNGYFSKGLDTIEKIAPVYTPPNSYKWMSGVNFFINDITKFEQEQELEVLKDKVLTYL